jgi:hypothetical protein
MLTDHGPLGTDVAAWHHGYLFAPALTVGGGTGEVQRNIVAERVLGLPHDVDVESGRTGQTWEQTGAEVGMRSREGVPRRRRRPEPASPGPPPVTGRAGPDSLSCAAGGALCWSVRRSR